MTHFRIVAWNNYQHYKDRNPPWIKLHRELLTSRMWVSCNDETRALAVACMLLAAATENNIPADTAYLKRVAYLNKKPDLKPLLDIGFIEAIESKDSASKVAQTVRNACSETEAETEAEKKEPLAISSPVVPKYSDDFEQFWRQSTKRGSKVEAFREWKKLGIVPSAIDPIFAGMFAWIQSDQWQDETKQPHICRWLKRRGWEEEVPRSHRPILSQDIGQHSDSGPHPPHRCQFCENPHEWECEYTRLNLSCGSPHDSACPTFASRFAR